MIAVRAYEKKRRLGQELPTIQGSEMKGMKHIIVAVLTHTLVALWSIDTLLKMTQCPRMAMLSTCHKTNTKLTLWN